MKIKSRRYYVYALACIAGFFVGILPLKLGILLAGLISKVVYFVSKKERERTLDNLRLAFPEKSAAETEGIARGVFSNVCKNAVELVNTYKLNRNTVEKWVGCQGAEKINEALAKGKGYIALASHFGNWELIPIYFSLKGVKANIIVRRIYFERYDRFIQGMRRSKGVNIIYRDESPRKILRALKRNEGVGILADQDVDSVDGVFVDFFGRPAFTPIAPVAISLATGAPLMPFFCIRENGRHRIVVESPIEMEQKATKEETLKFNTQKWTRVLESQIKKYPEQWVWMHRRWRTKKDELSQKK